MAVAKDRAPVNRTLERVPHAKIAYAFLDIETTGTVDEFLAYRAEMLEKHPLYAPSPIEKTVEAPVETATSEPEPEASAPTEAGPTTPAAVRAAKVRARAKSGAGDAGTTEEAAAAGASEAPTASAPPSGTQSARDIARAKILAKRGAK